MIKLVKVPEWVYTNCIYDKKIGPKLTEILRNISEWESSGKIKYQFDISENIDIFNKNYLMNLPPVPLSDSELEKISDIKNFKSSNISKEIGYPIFPITGNKQFNYIMAMNINHNIINDMMFFINYIKRNIKDPITGFRNPDISKRYVYYDDNFYFSTPNKFHGEDIIAASIHDSISNDITPNNEWFCVKFEINNVMNSELYGELCEIERNNVLETLDKMIN